MRSSRRDGRDDAQNALQARERAAFDRQVTLTVVLSRLHGKTSEDIIDKVEGFRARGDDLEGSLSALRVRRPHRIAVFKYRGYFK